MGKRLDRRLAKWDAANLAVLRKQNETAGGTWEEFNERYFAGPAVAYAISYLLVSGFVGATVLACAPVCMHAKGNQ
jgi:hypothetical protein